MNPTILIADDDALSRSILGEVLVEDGYAVVQVEDGLETLQVLREQPVDLLLLDLKMPGLDGMAILRTLADQHSTLPVIVLTAYGTIQIAVEATKLGAYDFIEKPLNLERVRLTIRRALDHARLQQNHTRLVERLRTQAALIGQSAPMRHIADLIARVAPTMMPVLIQGESGTGKELIARAIHAASGRASGPYVVVNCAALPGELIESELFGHGRGAFTGAVRSRVGKVQAADRGTLFLDEVGDMSLAAQAKILRMLEAGEVEPLGQDRPMIVSVRVLAATHQDLAAEIAAGRFRDDLYHRLNGMVIQVPPLRDRREDIPELVQHFLAGFCEENTLLPKVVAPDALDRLMAQDWPGNVRELKHAVQKLAVLVGGEVITALDVEAVVAGSNQHPPAQRVEPATWREARRQVERDLIVARLAAHGWRVDDTARALGLDRTYLYKKMKRLGIESGRRDSRLRGNDTIQQVASRTVPIQGGNATPNRTQRSNKTSPRRATHHKTRKRVRRPSPNILVSDDLWALIRPLVQPDPLSRTDGRPRLDDRAALTGILFVLKAGIAWESLPSTIGCGSGMTCWRRLREWQRAGVWGRIQRILLDRLDGAAQINWSRVSQDGGTATPSS